MLPELLRALERITGSMGQYFLEFSRVARDKADLGLGLRQYKTEKWLQAELAVHLRWTGLYGAVVEVHDAEATADLVVWAIDDSSKRVSVLLKCWQDSAQNATQEGNCLRTDIAWGQEESGRLAMALLPDQVVRPNYTETVLRVVEAHPQAEWEVPFGDLDRIPRRVRVCCWYRE